MRLDSASLIYFIIVFPFDDIMAAGQRKNTRCCAENNMRRSSFNPTAELS